MKLVAISGGRRNGNNEMLLRAALQSVKEACGCEIRMIRIHDLNIKDCTGCETCMRGLTTGGDGLCVIGDDDLGWLKEAARDADGLIVAAPVYDLIPSGTMITLLNRVLGIGKEYQAHCRETPKIGAVISLGGSDWVNLSEPLVDLTLTNFSKGAIVVDRLIVGNNPAPSMVVLDDDVMARARLLGKRVAEGMLNSENAKFCGDSGVCPGCHCNLLEPRGGLNVGCPYCNSQGEIAVENGALRVHWDAKSVAENRFTYAGMVEHRTHIGQNHKKAAENRDEIQRRKALLEDFGGEILKPQREETVC